MRINKKPLAIFGTVVLLLASLLALSGCGATTTPEKVDAATAPQGQGSAPEPAPAPKTFAVGDKIKMGDLAFTVNNVRTSNGDEFFKPSSGNTYKIVDVTIENVGQESTSISSMLMFSMMDAEGYKYNITIAPDTKGSVDGELQPARKLRGEVAFEVPQKAKGLELIFEPEVFGFGQAIVKID